MYATTLPIVEFMYPMCIFHVAMQYSGGVNGPRLIPRPAQGSNCGVPDPPVSNKPVLFVSNSSHGSTQLAKHGARQAEHADGPV